MILLALPDVAQHRVLSLDVLPDGASEDVRPGTFHLLGQLVQVSNGFGIDADAQDELFGFLRNSSL